MAPAGAIALLTGLGLGVAPVAVHADPTSAAAPGHRAKPFDLDGDGHGELAVGEPWHNPGGRVSVLRGTSNGVTTTGSKDIGQDTSGVAGVDEAGDDWGRAVTSGDFDRDGYADLAVGSLSENAYPDTTPGQGSVTILRGGPGGAPGHGSRVILPTDDQDIWGGGLAAGDLDHDGYDDLVISGGYPDDGVGRDDAVWSDFANGVTVLYGSPAGLDVARKIHLTEAAARGVDPPASAHFGHSIAIGDVNGDGIDDLGVASSGSQGEGVLIFYGRTGQLTTRADQYVDGMGTIEFTFGDFDGDGFDDLAGDSFATKASLAYVYRGSAAGIVTGSKRVLTDPGDPSGSAPSYSSFGRGFGAGDFDADGKDELVVGDTGRVDGAVYVYDGTASGVSDAHRTKWSRGSPGVPGQPRQGEGCGDFIRVADVGRSSVPDLVTTCLGGVGAVLVVYGHTGQGLTGTGAQAWRKDTPGVVGTTEVGYGWGKLDQ